MTQLFVFETRSCRGHLAADHRRQVRLAWILEATALEVQAGTAMHRSGA
jgi:hypothetical protein